MDVMQVTITPYDPGRLSTTKSLSENYVLIKNKGSIAFVASSHFGVVNYLNILLTDMYALIGHNDYGKSIGTIEADAGKQVLSLLPTDFIARCQTEEMSIHGDPAITINEQKLPDYDVEAQTVNISPSFISVADNHFDLGVTFYNLGKAVSDSISVLITRKFPDGSTTVVLKKTNSGNKIFGFNSHPGSYRSIERQRPEFYYRHHKFGQ